MGLPSYAVMTKQVFINQEKTRPKKDNGLAEQNIRDFLILLKKSGLRKISVIELTWHFSYPPEKILKVLEKFERQGLLMEAE